MKTIHALSLTLFFVLCFAQQSLASGITTCHVKAKVLKASTQKGKKKWSLKILTPFQGKNARFNKLPIWARCSHLWGKTLQTAVQIPRPRPSRIQRLIGPQKPLLRNSTHLFRVQIISSAMQGGKTFTLRKFRLLRLIPVKLQRRRCGNELRFKKRFRKP